MRSWGIIFIISLLLSPLGQRESSGFADVRNLSETILFRWVVDENRFEEITPSDIQPKSLYLRWDNRGQKYVWVSGDNRHLILSKTKVQGGRLGMTGRPALNWFEYNESEKLPWKKNTVRARPEIWRWDPTRVVAGSFESGIYRSEQAPEGWETFGGDLDPEVPPVKPPPVKPPPVGNLGCQLEASPANAIVGQTVLLSMKTWGPVISAMLDGAGVDFPVVMRSKVLEAALFSAPLPAKLTIRGQVKAPNQAVSECSVVISVAAQ